MSPSADGDELGRSERRQSMATEQPNVRLTRRDLLRTGAAAAAIAVVALRRPGSTPASGAAPAPAGAWNHDPTSPIGPLHWAEIGFPTCGQGTSQSPVDIRTGGVAAYHGGPLLLRYEPSELTVENTGHVVEVPIPADAHDTLQIGGDRYALVQYHFHAPSEHAVNGRRADVEAHFVHNNAQGATAVVGVFYRRGPHPNPVLDRILLAAPETAGEEAHAGEASPAALFRHLRGVNAPHGGPVRVDAFYAYDGSLTTPGCTEGVRWSVLADGGQVSGAAVARLHQVIARFPNYDGYPNNNRPTQPLNGRVIRLRRGEKHN
jgi:carbonic anhydrase